MPRPPHAARWAGAALAACALAACDDSPPPVTAPAAGGPAASLRPADPTTATPPSYHYTRLPFVPSDINDSAVIVGYLGSDAIKYRHGAYTTLPRYPGIPGDYQATAINNKGQIAGTVGVGHALFWPRSGQPPVLIAPADPQEAKGQVLPEAVNDAGVVVGSFSQPTADGGSVTRAFRWSQAGGWEDVTPILFTSAQALDVNADGTVVGFGWGYLTDLKVVALRLPPNGSAAQWQRLDVAGTAAQAVAPNGDAVGTADYFGTVRRWPSAGGQAPLAAPANSSPDNVSRAYRLVGHTYRYGTPSHRPYTVFKGVTTWLPIPDSANTDKVYRLRVDRCGSIVARQVYLNQVEGGLFWTKSRCDAVTPWS